MNFEQIEQEICELRNQLPPNYDLNPHGFYEFIGPDKSKVEVIKLCQMMEVYGGGFAEQLAKLFYRSDIYNQLKIIRTWPEMIADYSRFLAINENTE